MTFKKIVLCFLVCFPIAALCQQKEYVVSVDDRNAAIKLTNQAIKLIGDKKYSEAIPLLKKAIAIDSVYRTSYMQFYKASLLNNDHSENAIAYLKKAARIFEEDDEICYFLGECYRLNNQFKDAIAEYNSAIKFNAKAGENSPFFHLYYFNRAVCYMKLEQYDLAIPDLSNTLKIKADLPNALLNRGICYIKTNKKEEALADWNKAAALGNTAAGDYVKKYATQVTAKHKKIR
jgi:tetratricopeptide (TPR) repeat protein